MLKKFIPRNITLRGWIGSLLFIISFLAISWYYDYHHIVSYKPQSIHKWRQSDCASITLNYYQHGMNFFKPEVHHLSSDNRTTGYAVSECPILYYFIATLYKLFGYNDLIYRLVNTLIFFLGLFALFKLIERWLKDSFWGIAITLLFFTSPVVVYYANNYLTDSTSFAFVLMGWYFFFNFYSTRKQCYLNYSILVFGIAGLLKVTALMSVIAILVLYFVNTLGWFKRKQKGIILPSNLKTIIPFILYFTVIITWYLFSIHYNQEHQTKFFSTQIWPIWDLSKETILWIRNQMNELWLKDYFHLSVLMLFLFSFLFMLIFWKKIHPVLSSLTLLMFTGVVLFSLLWFYAFGNHDYYLIGLLVLPVFILISVADLIKKLYPRLLSSPVSKVIFGLFLMFNIYYAGQRLEWRYEGWINDYPSNKDLYEITPYLRSLGIEPGDKVISLPDRTPCYSLYLMNQKGWTERYVYNRDSLGIKKSISLGAMYLILTGEEVSQRSYLQFFMKDRIGQYKSISIYSLKDY